MNEREVTLVTEAQSGNSKCFEELYALYYKKVFAVIRTMVKNSADAEDILQQTFLSAWRNLKTLSNPAAFNTWIQRIAINHCNEFLRKKNLTILLDSEEELDAIAEDASDELLPAVYAERDDLRSRLGKIIEGLSEVQRQTIVLFYYNELKVDEIAKVMECSSNTVKARLVLARKAIRGEIEEQERRSGQKFYGMAGISMLPLAQFLAQQIEAEGLSSAVSGSILSGITSTIASEAAVAAQTAAGVSSTVAAESAAASSAAAGAASMAARAGAPLIAKIAAGIVAAAFTATAGVVIWLNSHNNILKQDDKAYLTEIAGELHLFLDEYADGAYQDDPIAGLNAAWNGAYAMQNTGKFEMIVDKVYEAQGEESLWYTPYDNTIVAIFRDEEHDAPCYHFNLYNGADGAGHFMGSKSGGGNTNYVLHVARYEDSLPNGMNHNYTFSVDPDRGTYVKSSLLRDGETVSDVLYEYSTGETMVHDSSRQSNWWPGWPEALGGRKHDRPVSEPTPVVLVKESPDVDYAALYRPALEEYRSTVWGTMLGQPWNWENGFIGVSEYFSHYPDAIAADFGYALKDLNEDGRPELILLSNDAQFFAIYSLVDDTPLCLKEFHARYSCSLGTDNIIYIQGSEGANVSVNEKYRVSPDGRSLVLIEAIGSQAEDPQTGEWTDEEHYYHIDGNNIKTVITLDEYLEFGFFEVPEEATLSFIPLFDSETIADCAQAYLPILKENQTGISAYHQSPANSLNGAIVLADLCGDEKPELLYLKRIDETFSSLHIWSCQNSEATEIFSDEAFDVLAGSGTTYALFTTIDGGFYIFHDLGGGGSRTSRYTRCELQGGALIETGTLQINYEDVGGGQSTRITCTNQGQVISEDTYRQLVSELEASINLMIINNGLTNEYVWKPDREYPQALVLNYQQAVAALELR